MAYLGRTETYNGVSVYLDALLNGPGHPGRWRPVCRNIAA
jgi:hypothetical protein